ncbi:MAG: UV DNA damage repair endonuclease UvsE [Bacilli bacterium]
MIIRLGYVAISKALDNITSSSSLSYTNYLKLPEEERLKKIDYTILSNLIDLKKIINYNIKNNIHFYRLTSKLIPLATHQDVDYDYIKPYQALFQEIGTLIKDNQLRVDVHPDQFAVLNSTKKEVVDNTFEILKYHHNILKALNIKNKIIILHIGSSVLGKTNSLKRFSNNFNKLPKEIRECIALENDDKTYNIEDCLTLCEQLNIPMVLDYHHYICNSGNLDINTYYNRIFNTWKNTNPKIHFSSPKNKTKKDMRSHHDYINPDDFIFFIDNIKKLPYDVDIMLEAKAKDDALFRLVRQLKYKSNYQFIDDTTFKVE